jgi:negative regulator of genetic competence, sporulation and motility
LQVENKYNLINYSKTPIRTSINKENLANYEPIERFHKDAKKSAKNKECTFITHFGTKIYISRDSLREYSANILSKRALYKNIWT